MNESLFVQYAAWFTKIAKTIEEQVNGKKTSLTYLFKDMLTKEISVDLKWDSLSVDGSVVAADVVAMDSALPLKKRGVLRSASGDIPKLGMKYYLSEKQMSDIDVMQARGISEKEIVSKIFDDTVKAIMGINEKLELMFLQGLSTGVTLVEDENNVGLGVRVDYGYQASNKYGTTVKWSEANAKPIDDIKRVIKAAKAKGDIITTLMMDDATFDNFAASQQTREQYAFSQNFVGTQIPVPDLEQVNAMMQRRYKLTIVVVDRSVYVERDGKKTAIKPWADNIVVFLTNTKVGKRVYGVLAEDTRRNPKVMYEKVDDYILLKKWSTEEPFSEFTSSQGLVLPVINNVDSIYLLDTEESAEDAQTEGDANFAYMGTNYTKASVAAALKLANPKTKLTVASTDAKLLEAINALNAEQIAIFEANITEAA